MENRARESWHEHQPFKAFPDPLINRIMRTNLRSFHPFTDEVMRAQLPQRWSWPNLEKYSGTSDPEAHVKAHMTQTQLLSMDMDVHCRLFPTTLAGMALEWYYYLPRNSVDSFETFCGRFLARFADCKPMAATSTSLHNVVQGETKRLENPPPPKDG